MRKVLFILLITIPFIGLSQNIYNEDDVKFNQENTLMLLKSDNTPVTGIVKKICKQKGMIFNIKTNCEFVIKNGLFISSKGYYKNNQISQETQRNGICKFYYKNGSIRYVGNMKEGMYDGSWKHFDKKGNLKREDIFKENDLTNEKYYKKNGLLDYENLWTSDNSYIFKLYYNGFLIEEGNINNGKREGVWKYYHLGTTELDKEIIFKNGKKLKN